MIARSVGRLPPPWVVPCHGLRVAARQRDAARWSRGSAGAVDLAKRSVLNAEERSSDDGRFGEQYVVAQVMRTPEARHRMRTFLDAGGQTRDGAVRVGDLTAEL